MTAPLAMNVLRRLLQSLALIECIVGLAIVLAPEGYLACADAIHEKSPDGAWTLSLCQRPSGMMAMPGHGGDGPAWIVLRDATGAIRGVSGLGLIQEYGASGEPVTWRAGMVEKPMTVELKLPPAQNRILVWLEDRIWRLRALAGLTTSGEDFR